jgi:hypothetical protein
MLIGAVAMAAAIGVTVSGVMSASASSTDTASSASNERALAASAKAARAGARPTPPKSTAKPTGQPVAAPLGSVISTGIKAPGGELVFYLTKIDVAELPDIHFGVMAALRGPAGHLTPGVLSNETEGTDDAPGFHAIEGSIASNGVAAPEFGYYSGPAAKITAQVGGRTVRAQQAAWSQDPRIVVFWFAPSAVPAGQEPTALTAYNAAGRKLPSGNSEVGHG